MDNVLIGWRWGAVELGFYSRAYNLLLTPISLVNGSVGQVILPLLSRHQDDEAEWRKYFLAALSFTCVACYAIATVLIVNSASLIRVVLGERWSYSSVIFYYLGLSLYAMIPMNAMGWVFSSLGRTDRWFKWGVFAAFMFLGAFAIGLPYHSVGVAKMYSATVTALAPICILYATRNTPVGIVQILAVVRGPVLAGVGTMLVSSWLLAKIGSSGVPFYDLLIGCTIASVMFALLILAALLIDPAQRNQRDLLWNFIVRKREALA
jgi:PST family polysaccharide transporter